MTNDEIMTILRSDTKLNKARQVFSNASARIEQAGLQRSRPGPIELRRMEIEAVREILAVYGVEP